MVLDTGPARQASTGDLETCSQHSWSLDLRELALSCRVVCRVTAFEVGKGSGTLKLHLHGAVEQEGLNGPTVQAESCFACCGTYAGLLTTSGAHLIEQFGGSRVSVLFSDTGVLLADRAFLCLSCFVRCDDLTDRAYDAGHRQSDGECWSAHGISSSQK